MSIALADLFFSKSDPVFLYFSVEISDTQHTDGLACSNVRERFHPWGVATGQTNPQHCGLGLGLEAKYFATASTVLASLTSL